jgi:hypothetical protein
LWLTLCRCAPPDDGPPEAHDRFAAN